MMPIAPRYRRSIESDDDTEQLLQPILTIPDWATQQRETFKSSGDIPPEAVSEPPTISVGTPTVETSAGPEPALEEAVLEKGPSAGRLRDTIHVYWSSAKVKGSRLRLPTRLPEAIRGILPGIGISTALILIWFLVHRGSTEPAKSDLTNQGSASLIEPLNEDPLRKPPKPSVAAVIPEPAKAPSVRVPAKPDKLFNEIPIIERSVTDHPVRNDGQVVPRASVALGSAAPAVSSGPESVVENTGEATATEPSSDVVTTTPSTTEYEWSPNPTPGDSPTDELTVAQRPQLPDNRRAAVRPRQSPPSQRQNDVVPRPELDSQPTYSYQRTDPSTYKDPAYEVPPVARRKDRDSSAQRGSLDSPATTRETPGRSKR